MQECSMSTVLSGYMIIYPRVSKNGCRGCEKLRSSAKNAERRKILTDIGMKEILVWSRSMFPKPPSNTRRRSKGRAAKNWFDSDDDIDDTNSLPSTEATLAGKDEEEGAAPLQNQQPFGPLRTTTKVSTGEGRIPAWSHGVSVTRQVIVETSSAVPPNA